ncbi:hypothetical protein LQZ18_07790 [Lachnospiraceae bacterium ZAX-1]
MSQKELGEKSGINEDLKSFEDSTNENIELRIYKILRDSNAIADQSLHRCN